MSTLERDLTIQIRRKLQIWASDAVELFEMAGLKNGGFVIIRSVVDFLAWTLVNSGLPKQTFLRIMGEAYDEFVALKKSKQKSGERK